MEQQLPVQPTSQQDDASQASSRALWQRAHRPRRERSISRHVDIRGPYETSYSIAVGYPDREVLRP